MRFRSNAILIVAILALLLCSVCRSDPPGKAAASRPSNEIDNQKTADATAWNFNLNTMGPLGNSDGNDHGFSIRLDLVPDVSGIHFEIRKGEKLIYSWQGHVNTIFRISRNTLYYTDYIIAEQGGDIVAVDLDSGKLLWRSPLQAVGFHNHSAYHNRINIELSLDTVDVWGDESFGRYFEIKRRSDGVTVGHHIYEESDTKPADVTTSGTETKK